MPELPEVETTRRGIAPHVEGLRIEAIVISLDDYYLSADQRKSLLANEHPLFSVRGVPGTHEIDWMIEHLKILKNEDHSRLSLPQFDKSKDDRKSERLIISPDFKPQVIFLEGWIAGVPPQASGELLTAVNEFEELEDPDCEWRTRVNSYLYDYHEAYKGLADQHWHLKAPDWASVIDWRLQQEVSAGQGLLNSREEVCRFLDHYERLCKHMDNTCSQWANSIIELDTNHFPTLVQLT